MIRRSVSAVCLLRDGFTGRSLSAVSLRCELDGRPCVPLRKPGGYLVLTDQEPGEHQLLIRSRGYQDETVIFSAAPGKVAEEVLALKPGPDYFFPAGVTRLTLTLTSGGRRLAASDVWLAAPSRAELKLSQERAETGARDIRLFCRGAVSLLPIPGPFLLSDGGNSEIVQLHTLAGETGALAAPLHKSHIRGRAFLPAQRFWTDSDGVLSAVFPSSGVFALLADGRYGELELKEGENALSLEL